VVSRGRQSCAGSGLFAALATLALLSGGVSQAQVTIEQIDVTRPIDVVGHRGLGGRYPESSLAGFEQALAVGVTTLQMNVQATRDRVLIVYHETELDPRRCSATNGQPLPRQPLSKLSWPELSEIVCRSQDSEQDSASAQPIPRLQDLLELAASADEPVKVCVEIETAAKLGIAVRDFVDLLATQIEQSGLTERTTVRSRDPQVLLTVRDRIPPASRAIVVGNRRAFERMLQKSDATILSPPFRQLVLDDVRQFRRRGIGVLPWVVNDADDIRRMILWGVDGILSDYPDRVVQVWRGLHPDPARSASGGSSVAKTRAAP